MLGIKDIPIMRVGFIFLILLPCCTIALKCKGKGKADVDWWFVLKPPAYVDAYMYLDSSSADWQLEKTVSLEALFNQHVEQANEANKEAYALLPNNKKSLFPAYLYPRQTGFDKLDKNIREQFAEKIKEVQYWFNDQPLSFNEGQWRTDSVTDGDYKYAHSKYLVSIGEATGFFLQHSFPTLPYSMNSFKKSTVFPPQRQKDVFQYSQHAFCFSFASAEGGTILDMIIHSRPRIVSLNVMPFMLKADSTIRNKLTDAINGKVGVETASKNCQTSWNAFIAGKTWQEVLLAPINAVCTKTHTIGALKIISHAPFKHESASLSDDKSDQDDSKLDRIYKETKNLMSHGPLPWLSVAKIIGHSIIVDTWKNMDLQSLRLAGGQSVWMVDQISFDFQNLQWKHGAGHEKIAVSVDAGSSWACFADGNHRYSEITHAGITVCLNNAGKLYEGLSKGFLTLVESYLDTTPPLLLMPPYITGREANTKKLAEEDVVPPPREKKLKRTRSKSLNLQTAKQKADLKRRKMERVEAAKKKNPLAILKGEPMDLK